MTSESNTISPERWQQIDAVFQAAVELEPEQRAVYLDGVCQGDLLLREKVETMLADDDHPWQWLEESAVEAAAQSLLAEENQLAPGQIFSHYQIEKMIGKGGMGEVYLAADKLLNRKVALKLLPIDYTRDERRLRRFQQEARAASALNHPNILTIYELREVDGQQYIATEFVAGETLRQRLKRAPLSLSETLEIAIQIASALAAAHQADIVHRDIKPENIMLRPDGYVKVLDFGLAKLTEQYEPAPPVSSVGTTDLSSGLVMGTLKYMSPEQARGMSVDARSDIFSFGVVLYEMIAGRVPFEGDANQDLVAAIMKKEPDQLGNAPAELQRIISEALNKEKEERYQKAEVLLIDLKRLKETLDLQTKFQSPDITISQLGVAANSSPSKARVPHTETISTALSIEYLLSGIKQHKSVAGIVTSILLISTLGIGYLAYNSLASKRTASPKTFELTGLTSSGNVASAAISPDGKFVAYVSVGLWIRELATNKQVELIHGPQGDFWGLTFSPDGNYLYYFAELKDYPESPALYRIPAVGGVPTKLIANTFNTNGPDRVTFSPDGTHLAFIREYPSGETALILANVDGTDERKLATRHAPPSYFGSAAWSPDGKKIACRGGYQENKTNHKDLIEIGVDDGVEKPITTQEWQWIGDIAWVRDGSALLITASDPNGQSEQIWKVDYPSGTSHRISADLNRYAGLSLTSDSRVLVSVRGQTTMNIWTQHKDDLSQARQITSGGAAKDGMAGIGWTPDGRIVYSSEASGRSDIWIMNADGSNPKQLTRDLGTDRNGLSVSPDGRYVVFVSNQGGQNNIWRVDIDGSNPKQLTNGPAGLNPIFSADGQWVEYRSRGSGAPSRWKVPVDGGDPIQVTDPFGDPEKALDVSPDGNLVAYDSSSNDQATGKKIGVAQIGGKDTIRIFDLPLGQSGLQHIRWTPDGGALTYFDNREAQNIWIQPLDGPPRRLTDFKTDRIFNFAWSRDGKQLAIVRQIRSSDVVLMRNL